MSDPVSAPSPHCDALSEVAVVLRSQARRLRIEANRLDRLAQESRAAGAFYREQERRDRLSWTLPGSADRPTAA